MLKPDVGYSGAEFPRASALTSARIPFSSPDKDKQGALGLLITDEQLTKKQVLHNFS